MFNVKITTPRKHFPQRKLQVPLQQMLIDYYYYQRPWSDRVFPLKHVLVVSRGVATMKQLINATLAKQTVSTEVVLISSAFLQHLWVTDIQLLWSANCGLRPKCRPLRTFYWAARPLLLWAAWYVWATQSCASCVDQTRATVTTIQHWLFDGNNSIAFVTIRFMTFK